MRWWFLSIAFFSVLDPGKIAAGEKDFARELDALRGITASDLGREELVGRYQKIIARHASHPDVALAYIELAGFFSCESVDHIRYLDAAANHARPGSDNWVQAKLYLCDCFKYNAPDRARAILQAAEIHVAADPWKLARVNNALQECCYATKNYAEAEAICRKVLALECPLGHPASDRLDEEKNRAANIFIGQIAQAIWLKREARIAVIAKLIEDFPFLDLGFAINSGRLAEATKLIDRFPEDTTPPFAPVRLAGLPAKTTGNRPWQFLAYFLGAVLIFAAVVGAMIYAGRLKKKPHAKG